MTTVYAVLLLAAAVQSGSSDLAVPGALITIPSGCTGSVTRGIDTVRGTVECAKARLTIHLEGGGMYPDVCGLFQSEATGQPASTAGNASRFVTKHGIDIAVCSARGRSGQPELAVGVNRGLLTLWAVPASPQAIAIVMSIAESYRTESKK